MNTHQFTNFRLERSSSTVTTVWLDVPDHRVNVFNGRVIEELSKIVDDLASQRHLKAVVFRSAKPKGFLAGADINAIAAISDPDEARKTIEYGQQLFERIERLPMRTIAAVHGPCVGGGLEFALACRYRVARDDGHTRLGLPEIQLGLIPGWGGTQRLPALCGLSSSLPLILKGTLLTAAEAHRIALVDVLVPPDDWDQPLESLVPQLFGDDEAAEDMRPARPTSIIRAFLDSTALGRWIVFTAAQRRIDRQADHYPALSSALKAVKEGHHSRARGLKAEREEFTRLIFSTTSRNLQQIFFYRERARHPGTWSSVATEEAENGRMPTGIQRVAVVGAGVMGSAIGQLAAYKGCEVVLKEIDASAAAAGLKRVHGLFDSLVKRKRLHPDQLDHHLTRIRSTTDWSDLAHADLVIEAASERPDIKQDIFRRVDEVVQSQALLTTNTSSLRVDPLADATQRPAQVAGLHFFNPVHRMELVEVVKTAQTSDETIARLVQFVRFLGKTPIVTSDSPGFVVNRVLFPYLGEAVRMVFEGVAVKEIDRQMRSFGMPMGPLELLDQVGIDVAAHVAGSLATVLPESEAAAARLGEMVQNQRLGKKSGEGFYDYGGGGQRGRSFKAMYPLAEDPFVRNVDARDHLTAIQRRLIYPMLNEAARCLEQRIVPEPWMVDLAMVLGTGFAPFTGGPLRLVDTIGTRRLVQNMQMLGHAYGDRFQPTLMLREIADADRTLHVADPNHPPFDFVTPA